MSSHVYGPVPSRRLGRSLGIDVTPPLPNKTCNFNCVYCQLGRTRHFSNQKREFFPVDKLLNQAERHISSVGTDNIDYLTLVGDGEPTLYSKIGDLIDGLKIWDIPICVITNGSLLSSEKVRKALGSADVILPTLDAGTEQEFKLRNRPIRHIHFDNMVKGMIEFRNSFEGKIWMEFMAVSGVNDQIISLQETRAIYEQISPDKIYVNTPIRPPCENWVKTPSLENIELIQDMLGPSAKEEIIPINLMEQGEFYIEGDKESVIIQNLVNTIKRHPMRRDQVENVLLKKRMKYPEDTIKTILSLNINQREFQGKEFFIFCEP